MEQGIFHVRENDGFDQNKLITDSDADRMYLLCYRLADSHKEAKRLYEDVEYSELYKLMMLDLASGYRGQRD